VPKSGPFKNEGIHEIRVGYFGVFVPPWIWQSDQLKQRASMGMSMKVYKSRYYLHYQD
jgi:hypothetical protein